MVLAVHCLVAELRHKRREAVTVSHAKIEIFNFSLKIGFPCAASFKLSGRGAIVCGLRVTWKWPLSPPSLQKVGKQGIGKVSERPNLVPLFHVFPRRPSVPTQRDSFSKSV